MPLDLTRPLAFIDLESTGTGSSRSVLKLHPDGREEFRCKRLKDGRPEKTWSAYHPHQTKHSHGLNSPFRAGVR